MIIKTRGIVLHTTRYGDTSLIVHAYTQEYGRQTFMLKGVRKSGKAGRSSMFQPLFILDFEVYRKDGRDIQLVKEVSRPVILNSLPFDIVKSTQAIFIAEVLYRVVKEEESNPVLSRFLLNSIEYLDALENPMPDFHIIFLFHLSRHLGFYPQNNCSSTTPYFELGEGKFKAYAKDPEKSLDRDSSDLWSRYLKLDYESGISCGFNSGQRKTTLDNLIRYYKFHVSSMGEIRSLEVLRSLFHNS